MRKRKWWIVGGALLLLTAYMAFNFTKPAPRPEFLAKFRNQTDYETYYWLAGPNSIHTIGHVRIHAPISEVALALADEIGDENTFLATHSVGGSKGNMSISLNPFTFKGKPCTGVTFGYWHPNAWPQAQLAKYAPHWLDRMYGTKKGVYGSGILADLTINLETLSAKIPRLKIHPSVLNSLRMQQEEAAMMHRAREEAVKMERAREAASGNRK